MASVLAQKAPGDVVEYTINVDGIEDDTIASITVTAAGITVAGSPAPSHVDRTVVFWVTGGQLGASASVVLTMVTTGGRTLVREFTIPIRAL